MEGTAEVRIKESQRQGVKEKRTKMSITNIFQRLPRNLFDFIGVWKKLYGAYDPGRSEKTYQSVMPSDNPA